MDLQGGGYIRDYKGTFLHQCDQHTAESIWEMADDLADKANVLGVGKFKELEKAYGLCHVPDGLLMDRWLRRFVDPVKAIYYDLMHTVLASSGIAQYQIWGVIQALSEYGVTRFFSTRLPKTRFGHMRAFANEMRCALDAVPQERMMRALHIITTVCSMEWLVWEHWRGKWWCKQVLVSFSRTGQRVAGWRWMRPQKMRWRGWTGSWKRAWPNCVIIRHPDWRGFVVLLWKDGKIVPTPRSRKMIENDCDEAPVSIVEEFIDLRQEYEWELM